MNKLILIGKAIGNSMRPFINPGDKLYIKKVQTNQLHIGDIIVFYDNKDLISHRVVIKKNNNIITKGDNSLYFDKPVNDQIILGKLIHIKKGKDFINLDSKLAYFINYYYVFYSVLIIKVSSLAIWIIVNIFRGRRILLRFLRKK